MVGFSAARPIRTSMIPNIRENGQDSSIVNGKTCINFYSYRKWQWKKKSVVSRVMGPSRKCQFPRRSREGRRPLRLCIFLAVFIYLYFSLRTIRAHVALSTLGSGARISLMLTLGKGRDRHETRPTAGGHVT